MAEDGRGGLVEKLSRWDGINVVTIEPAAGTRLKFQAVDEQEMQLGYGNTEYRLGDLAWRKAGRLCGMSDSYLRKTPTVLIEPHLNYWFRKFPFFHVVYDEELENEIVSFNLTENFRFVKPGDMFEIGDSIIREKIDGIFLYDKIHVSEDKVVYSIVSDLGKNMGDARRGDVINAGIRVDMSSVAETSITLRLYMLRLVCTNGATRPYDVEKLSMSDTDHWEKWVDNAVSNLLALSAKEFARIRALQGVRVRDLGTPLGSLFKRVTMTRELRRALENSFWNVKITNMYDFYNHISEFANGFDVDAEISHIERLQHAAGFVSAHKFCDKCHRFLNEQETGNIGVF